MPYSIRKIGKNKYQVYNTATGEVHSKGTSKKKAEGQFRLLQGVARKEVIGLEGGINPNPVAFAKNEAEGQFSRYGSGYPANPSDYQPRRFL